MTGKTLTLAAILFLATHGEAIKHRFILLDWQTQEVMLVDQFNPSHDWKTTVTTGTAMNSRDLQLVGNNRVMVSLLSGGYCELDLSNGAIVKKVTALGSSNIQSARRLANGHTLLFSRDDFHSVTVYDVDSSDRTTRTICFPNTEYGYMLRLTPRNTFLFGSNDTIVEADWNGKVLWKKSVGRAPGLYQSPGIYQASRLPGGNIIAATGHGANITVLDTAGRVVKTWGGLNQPQADSVKPNFFAMFQVLKNGHIVAINWRGQITDGKSSGMQVLEYDSSGRVAWFYRDTARVIAPEGILVIDSLDTKFVYDDMNGGVLMPVNSGVSICFRHIQNPQRGQSLLPVTGDRSMLPPSLRNSPEPLSVYNLNGKRIKRITIKPGSAGTIGNLHLAGGVHMIKTEPSR